jgi:hypothetical protein
MTRAPAQRSTRPGHSSTVPGGRDCSASPPSAPTEAARLAARSAGDAASAAYLHPLANAHQVGHILRASACAARIGEMEAAGDSGIGDALLERSRQRATPVLIDVLRRYPPATSGSNRVAQLMSTLDQSLRQAADPSPGQTAPSRAGARNRERTS